jgi:hypothetical protein
MRFVVRAPSHPGSYSIGPVSVRAGTRRARSQRVEVQVIAAGAVGTPRTSASGELFAEFTVLPAHPFVGQQFTITAHVYSRVRLEGVSDLDYPEAAGIWWEPLDNPSRAGSEVVLRSGRRYRRHMVGRIAGFAESAGELLLSGGEVKVQVLQGDLFFGGLKDKTLRAHPLALQVRPLPEGVLASQVGAYKVSHGFVPTRLDLGDVFELKVSVRGAGNIQGFSLPAFDLPSGLRAFAPKREVSPQKDANTIGGTLKWTLPVQAMVPGKHRVAPIQVQWFDPATQRIRSHDIGPFEFDVIGTLSVPEARLEDGEGGDSVVVRGPIGGFRGRQPRLALLSEPLAALGLALLAALAWIPRRRTVAPEAGPVALGDLEAALERLLQVPVRGLERDAVINLAVIHLGADPAAELAQHLAVLDGAAYGPEAGAAEAAKAEVIAWLEARL